MSTDKQKLGVFGEDLVVKKIFKNKKKAIMLTLVVTILLTEIIPIFCIKKVGQE